jgi:acetyltransferase-like isoleucine patch superfamily enzyme
MERGLNLDRLNPKGIHIGERSIVTSNVTILSHRNIVPIKKENQWIWENTDTYIGDDCVIGIGVIILAGVRIGDEVVVAAGSVVTRNVPSKSIAAGNPAKIIKRDIDIHNILL